MTANAIALMARSLSFDSEFMSPFSVNARRNNINATGKPRFFLFKYILPIDKIRQLITELNCQLSVFCRLWPSKHQFDIVCVRCLHNDLVFYLSVFYHCFYQTITKQTSLCKKSLRPNCR